MAVGAPPCGIGPTDKGNRYNTLPATYHGKPGTEPPFGDSPGDLPRPAEQDSRDIAAFPNTLTDADPVRHDGLQLTRRCQ